MGKGSGPSVSSWTGEGVGVCTMKGFNPSIEMSIVAVPKMNGLLLSSLISFPVSSPGVASGLGHSCTERG